MSVSVLMINDKGLMISVLGQDYFLSYNRIPWMRNASISDGSTYRCADATPLNGLIWM